MIKTVVPKLPFIDRNATVRFYEEGLGYVLATDFGDYLIMELPGAELHFFAFPDLDPLQSHFMIYLRVEGIDRLYMEVQEKGISIHPNAPLEVKPWGQKEFAVIDTNGTLLTFGEADL